MTPDRIAMTLAAWYVGCLFGMEARDVWERWKLRRFWRKFERAHFPK